MKKIVTLFLTCIVSLSIAQTTILNENFESGALPAGWNQITIASDGGWKFGTSSALSSSYFIIPDHTKIAATNDDGCGSTCDKMADILISPIIDLTTYTKVFLNVDVYFFAGTYNGKTEVGTIEASTDSGATWTVVKTLGGSGDWRTEMLDVSAYAGNDTVQFAVKYSDAGDWLYGLAIDNFHVYEPLSYDVTTTSLTIDDYILMNSQTLSGKLKNLGSATITSMDLNYSVDGGAPVTQSLSALNIAPLAEYTFTHGTPWVPSSAGFHDIKIWASNINANADQDNANDTLTKTVYTATTLAQRKVLLEQFTSSTCGPCATYNPAFNTLLVNNGVNTASGKVAAIKYQVNFPSPGNDPAYTAEVGTRRTFYGVDGIPNTQMGSEFDGHTASVDQALINQEYARPALFDLSISSTYRDSTVNVTVISKSHVELNSNALKLRVALVEDTITHTAATNGENEFFQVFRKMLPDANGAAMQIQTAGMIDTFTYTYKFGTSPKLFSTMSGLTVVAFIQDNTTKEIHQVATFKPVLDNTGINEDDNKARLSLYPNPSNGKFNLVLDLAKAEDITVTVTDILGKDVYQKREQSAASLKTQIDLGAQPAGIYFVRINAGGEQITKKIILN